MLVDDDSITSYNKNKRERNNEVKTKIVDYKDREIEKVFCKDVSCKTSKKG